MENFGQKLRKLRVGRNLTLKELAAGLGYDSHSYLSEVELGRKSPSVDFAVAVSRFFNVTTDQLLKDELSINSDIPDARD